MTERSFPPGGYLGAEDDVPYIHDYKLPPEASRRTVCRSFRPREDTSWMDPDYPTEAEDSWMDA